MTKEKRFIIEIIRLDESRRKKSILIDLEKNAPLSERNLFRRQIVQEIERVAKLMLFDE